MIDGRPRIGDEVYIHGYIDEIRKDVIIIRNEGGYFGTVPIEMFYYEEDSNGYGTMNEADRKTEPQYDDEFKLFDREELILLIECQKERIAELLAKTENSSEKPNNCETCRFELYCPEMCEGCCEWDSHYEPKDEPHHSGEVTEMVEPQTDGYMTAEQTVDCAWMKGE